MYPVWSACEEGPSKAVYDDFVEMIQANCLWK